MLTCILGRYLQKGKYLIMFTSHMPHTCILGRYLQKGKYLIMFTSHMPQQK